MGALSCGVLRYTSAFSIAVTSGLEGCIGFAQLC